jgi:hypothetical protein
MAMDLIKDKYIFIHVPKTGGSTISAILNSKSVKPIINNIHLGMHTPRLNRCIQHDQGLVDITPYSEFLIVSRPPLARLVSLYVQSVQYYDQYDRCQQCGEYSCTDHDYKDSRAWFDRLNNFTLNQTLEMLKLNGELPEVIHTLRFDHLEQDFRQFMDTELDIKIDRFPHVNRKQSVYTDMYDELLSDPYLIDLVNERARPELEFLTGSL